MSFKLGRHAARPVIFRSSAVLASLSRNYAAGPRSREPRLAIIGSGPAGFYTAHKFMSKMKKSKVDMYEALPVPFGLSRFGVAPDHPEVKECEARFREVASNPNFTFIGNVAVGDCSSRAHEGGCYVRLASLMSHYDVIVFSYGASEDRTLGIPGEDLKGIYSAREFVGWYNGLPQLAHLEPTLHLAEEATIIGHGNVALDVARILLTNVDELRRTDMPEYALEALSRSRVRRVHIVGRRGPLQAAFTNKELRELAENRALGFNTDNFPRTLLPGSKVDRTRMRMHQTFEKLLNRPPVSYRSRTWSLDFLLSPQKFNSHRDQTDHVGAVQFERNKLSNKSDRAATVTGTGEMVEIPSQIVFRSIGYKAAPLPGFEEANIGFDHNKGHIISHRKGGVMSGTNEDGSPFRSKLPGLYCTGWVRTGPTGKIVGTMMDAFGTAETIVEDWNESKEFLNDHCDDERPGWDAVKSELGPGSQSPPRVITWADWEHIDVTEKQNGGMRGKPREKITDIDQILRISSTPVG